MDALSRHGAVETTTEPQMHDALEFDTLWAVHRGARTQNRENNPMQSRMGPGSQRSCGLRPGREKKNGPSSPPRPNLIPLVVDARQHVIEDKWRRGRRVAAAASREDTHIGSADAGTIAL
jgi:hypothetical protein